MKASLIHREVVLKDIRHQNRIQSDFVYITGRCTSLNYCQTETSGFNFTET